jgi:hypothetical protein
VIFLGERVVEILNLSYRRPFLVNIVHGAKNRSLRKLDLTSRRKQETAGSRSLTMVVVILVALVRKGSRDELVNGAEEPVVCAQAPLTSTESPLLFAVLPPFAHV